MRNRKGGSLNSHANVNFPDSGSSPDRSDLNLTTQPHKACVPGKREYQAKTGNLKNKFQAVSAVFFRRH